MSNAAVLYHPIGLIEMGQIVGSQFSQLPENARGQYRFFATLEEAEQLVDTELVSSLESAFVGYVVRAMVDPADLSEFGTLPMTLDGAQLERLNRFLDGPLRVQSASYGQAYHGYIPQAFNLAGQEVAEQFLTLQRLAESDDPDALRDEIGGNHRAIYLNYPYWVGNDFSDLGMDEQAKEALLSKVEEHWAWAFPDIILYRDVVIL